MVELPLFVRIIPKNLREVKGNVEKRLSNINIVGRVGGVRGGGAGGISPGVQAGALAEGIGMLAEENKGMAKGIFGMVGKLAGILGAVIFIAHAIMSLKPIQKMFDLLTTAFQLFILPFVMMAFRLLKPALVFLIRMMMLWYQFWKDPVGNIQSALSSLFEGVTTGISNLGSTIASGLAGVGSTLSTTIQGAGNWVMDLGKSASNTISNFLQNTFGEDVAKTYQDIIKSGMNILGGIGQFVNDLLQGNFSQAFQDLLQIGGYVWDLLTNIFQLQFQILSKIGKWIWDTLTDVLGKAWNSLTKFGSWLWDSITSTIWSGLGVLANLGKQIFDWVWEKITGIGASIGSFVGNIFSSTKKAVGLGDFIISGGKVYKTHPQDTIVGFKGKSPTSTINNFHISVAGFMDDDLINVLVDKISDEMDKRTRW